MPRKRIFLLAKRWLGLLSSLVPKRMAKMPLGLDGDVTIMQLNC
ncbi:unnamed protein product [Brassica oleracea var. botrytis]